VPQLKAQSTTSIHAFLFSRKLVLFVVVLAFFCRQSSAYAVDLGARAPDFSLENLSGASVDLASSTGDTLLILLFFDPSAPGAPSALSRLNATVSKNSKDLSLLGIAVGNPEAIGSTLGGTGELASITLVDNKGIASDYGFRRKLPAAAIVGPGGRVVAALASAPDPAEILMAAADAYISLLLPSRAKQVYQAVSADYPDTDGAKLGEGYATMMAGNPKKARKILDSLAAGDSSGSAEAHAAIGFLEYTLGRDDRALAACDRASDGGFAEYVMGMVNARSGDCKAASTLFKRATRGQFAFRWQKALAFNMAARTADARGSAETAVQAYRKASFFAPLNPIINANLLAYHWGSNNAPAATEYVLRIESAGSGDLLVQTLVDEFKAHKEFMADTKARRDLERQLGEKRSRRASRSGRSAGAKRRILIPDISFNGCVSELDYLPLSSAGLLKQGLENTGSFIVVPRAEMLVAADQEHFDLSQGWSRKAKPLLKVARAFSADLVTLAEVGSYGSEFFVNIRIADATSGVVIAVASERFLSLNDLGPAIQKSAMRLDEKVKAHYGH
jgi:tetratricopeptide (TPR) repeat protein